MVKTGVDLLTTSVTTVESDGEPYTLVELAGEADVTNSDALREALEAEVAKQPGTLIIDLSGLRFMDSSATAWPLASRPSPRSRPSRSASSGTRSARTREVSSSRT